MSQIAAPLAASGDVAASRRNAAVIAAWRTAAQRALREPLLHFLVLGGLLYAASAALSGREDRQRILVSRADIAGISTNYELQYGVQPTDVQLNALIDAFVREEIYYREALSAGLDRNDEIVRRRLVQKYEFLQQDLASIPETDDATLNAWFREHRSQYEQPARISFTQVYFSPDRREEQAAYDRALRERASLTSSGRTRAPGDGDVFPGTTDFSALTAQDVERVFGPGQLSDQIFSLPRSTWSPPLRSGLGWHLIRIDAIEPAQIPAFSEVSERVRRDWSAAQRSRRNDDDYARLKARYTIVRQ